MDVIPMKQIYKVHYKEKATKNEPSDLIDIKVEEVGKCPCCGIATSPTFLEGFVIPHSDLPHIIYAYVALYCTSCHSIYTARYISNGGILDLQLDSVFPKIAKEISFSDNINELSPTFVSLYNQASVAETNIQIYGLAGIGYRKSLEYLIKDYLIKIKHQDKDTIIKMDLGNCVNKLEGQIKTIAKASIWIGNDETHYFRKNPEYDIEDLKSFIDVLIHIIEIDFATEKAENLVKKK